MRGRRWQQSSSADAAVSVEISGSNTTSRVCRHRLGLTVVGATHATFIGQRCDQPARGLLEVPCVLERQPRGRGLSRDRPEGGPRAAEALVAKRRPRPPTPRTPRRRGPRPRPSSNVPVHDGLHPRQLGGPKTSKKRARTSSSSRYSPMPTASPSTLATDSLRSSPQSPPTSSSRSIAASRPMDRSWSARSSPQLRYCAH